MHIFFNVLVTLLAYWKVSLFLTFFYPGYGTRTVTLANREEKLKCHLVWYVIRVCTVCLVNLLFWDIKLKAWSYKDISTSASLKTKFTVPYLLYCMFGENYPNENG